MLENEWTIGLFEFQSSRHQKGTEEENLGLSWEWPDITVHTLPRSYGSSLSGEHAYQMLS